ncbi:MAG: transporter [Selenomonas sp.]|uniref:AEC family transporter n=1 Tax=Selenomonas ruminantium TaxID=971 RepID=UPI001B1F251F|nr:transporter [Selenomonas ruminantium]MBO5651809.1 transporter [Selenomonas sp.]
MDGTTMRILYVVTDLILPLVVGYFMHQRHWVSENIINKVIRFNVICVYTTLSLLSFWVLPLSWNLLLVPLFGMLLVLLPGAIGYVLFARHIENLLDRGSFIASAMLANLGTLGGVCAFILYNEQGFAYSQLIGTTQNVLLCIVVFPLAQFYYLKHTAAVRKSSRSHSFREMFFSINQLSLLGMAGGLILNANGIARPEILGSIFQSLVHIAAWIAMLPVGFLIDFGKVRQYARDVRTLTLLRFVITPAIFIALTWLIITDPILRGTLTILTFCPTAINAVLAAKIYKLNVDMAVSSFVITTAAYLLLIFPLLFLCLH